MTRNLSPLAVLVAFATLAPAAEPARVDLFEAGTGGYALYRIPGIVVTPKGSILAYCEARKGSSSDWSETDILLRRSGDGGKTWSEAAKVGVVPAGAEKNPAALAQKLGKPGEITLNNPVALPGPADGGVVHLLYCVEYNRCFHRRSDDDGKTWGEPTEITDTFREFRKDYDWKVLVTGPGHGIRLKNGRLLVPVWLSDGSGGHAHRPSCVATIFSDDEGKTWKRGDIVCANPKPKNPNETTAAELADGSVMLNIRHEDKPARRAVAVSADGATKWGPVRFDDGLPEPVCFGSLCRLPTDAGPGKESLLFSNPDHPEGGRRNLTVKLSRDGGRTWPTARVLEPGLAGYSDLAVGSGHIFCFFERGAADGKSQTRSKWLTLATFEPAWLARD